MKKYLSILICLILFLALAGCRDHMNNNSTVEALKTKAATSQPAEKTDWKPTKHETVNQLAGVTMIVQEGTASTAGLTIEFENKSNRQCLYGESYCLEKSINGGWYQVPMVIDGNYAFNDIGYELASGNKSGKAVNWDWLYGHLETGKYRIVKDIIAIKDPGKNDCFYLAAEFSI